MHFLMEHTFSAEGEVCREEAQQIWHAADWLRLSWIDPLRQEDAIYI